MAKRRTKKQKISAKRSTGITWVPGAGSSSNNKPVKGEIKKKSTTSRTKSSTVKNSDDMAKDDYLSTTKRDIIKTLATTAFILGLEIVLYWALQG